MDEVPARIKLARYRAGLTQEQLADRMGWHKNTIAKYEKGEFLPSPARYKALCLEIGIDDAVAVSESPAKAAAGPTVAA